jgi:hypothetical protein
VPENRGAWEFRPHQKAIFLSSQIIFNFRAAYVQVFFTQSNQHRTISQ